jgi:hypothetical protein
MTETAQRQLTDPWIMAVANELERELIPYNMEFPMAEQRLQIPMMKMSVSTHCQCHVIAVPWGDEMDFTQYTSYKARPVDMHYSPTQLAKLVICNRWKDILSLE